MCILAAISHRASAPADKIARHRAWGLLLAACLALLVAGCGGSPGQQESVATGTASDGAAPDGRAPDDTASDGSSQPAVSAKSSLPENPLAAQPAGGTVAQQAPSAVDAQLQEDLIRSVIDNFNHLDEFDPSQILPRLRDRLNQWMRYSHRQTSWQRDPLLATLDPAFTSVPLTARILANLENGLFNIPDGDMTALQEGLWLRNIAKHARGDQLDDLSVAEQLFDWTVRNIQLSEDPPADAPPDPHSPAEILLRGRGTARERAWIFLLLLRQQGLDGVVLAIPASKSGETNSGEAAKDEAAKDASGKTSAAPREWLTALVSDDGLYLFDPVLGMPLPGPEGHRIATLADLAADDGLLRRLDLDSKRPYPIKAEQLTGLIAYVEASPAALSRRMETFEARLTGDQRVVLTAHPQRVADRLAGRPEIGSVRCWPLPYELLQARGALKPGQFPPSITELAVFQVVEPLTKARVLQFKGAIDGHRGAIHYFLESRLSKDELAHLRIRPEEKQLWAIAKQDASYWLGLIAFEQKHYPVAHDYFSRRTLQADPDGPWTDGAHYNLARTYEELGDLASAIDLYQSDRSPQKHGNRLRARRLKAQIATTDPASAEPASEEEAP